MNPEENFRKVLGRFQMAEATRRSICASPNRQESAMCIISFQGPHTESSFSSAFLAKISRNFEKISNEKNPKECFQFSHKSDEEL